MSFSMTSHTTSTQPESTPSQRKATANETSSSYSLSFPLEPLSVLLSTLPPHASQYLPVAYQTAFIASFPEDYYEEGT
jgi:hypothetical protein